MIGGVAAALTVARTPLFAIVLLGALLLVSLEAIEPLSQEVDHPDRTDALPIDRGVLFAHHLVAPAGLLVIAAMVGAATATLVEPGYAAGAFALAIPITWTGALGAVVTTVRDAPRVVRPIGTGDARPTATDNPLLPPEFAGFSLVVNALLPVVLTALGTVPAVVMYFEPNVGTAVRTSIGSALAIAAAVAWVIRRDRWSSALNAFLAEGRAARAGGSG
jgi:hypothetical protein